MKDIVIIANFCALVQPDSNNRFLYIADMLSKNENYSVELVTSVFDHGSKIFIKKDQAEQIRNSRHYKITFLKEPGYPTNVCLQRFKSHSVWGRNVEAYIKHRKRPDLIYCAVPSLTAPYLVSKYANENNISFIIDVQDLWPEAFRMAFNIPIVSDVAFEPFKHLADGIYRRADEIIGVSQTYVNRALHENKKLTEGYCVFLGTDLSTFDKFAKQNKVIKQNQDEIWIAYCGTLGTSYDISTVIKALSLINNPNIRFVVMGDGPKRTEFENLAAKYNVNALFTGQLLYPEMCGMLSACDINVNPIIHGASQSIINKHADYAASGHPVVSTQEGQEYRKLVHDYQMGFNCKNEDAEDVAKKLKRLIEDESLRREMGKNARKCAEERFDREVSYNEIMKVIENGLS